MKWRFDIPGFVPRSNVMALISWGNKIYYEGNAGVPAGEKWSKCYDLALFGELGNPLGLVLWVTVILSFDFVDAGGGDWSASEQADFKNGIKTKCESAWSDKFKIRAMFCSDDLPTTASVAITVRTDGSYASSHWSVTARKVASPVQNYVRDNNDVRFESTGLTPAVPYGGSKPRISLVHEFGHLLGLRDEYPGSDRGTDKYTGDADSMMNLGSEIRARHYVFFADWLTNLPKKTCKVQGTWFVDGPDGPRTLSNTPM
jgi:hypothetical protein